MKKILKLAILLIPVLAACSAPLVGSSYGPNDSTSIQEDPASSSQIEDLPYKCTVNYISKNSGTVISTFVYGDKEELTKGSGKERLFKAIETNYEKVNVKGYYKTEGFNRSSVDTSSLATETLVTYPVELEKVYYEIEYRGLVVWHSEKVTYEDEVTLPDFPQEDADCKVVKTEIRTRSDTTPREYELPKTVKISDVCGDEPNVWGYETIYIDQILDYKYIDITAVIVTTEEANKGEVPITSYKKIGEVPIEDYYSSYFCPRERSVKDENGNWIDVNYNHDIRDFVKDAGFDTYEGRAIKSDVQYLASFYRDPKTGNEISLSSFEETVVVDGVTYQYSRIDRSIITLYPATDIEDVRPSLSQVYDGKIVIVCRYSAA